MENKEIKIIDYKDYIMPDIKDEIEFSETVLEDIKGNFFKFKYRKPTTSELIRVRREATGVITTPNGELVSNIKYEKAFELIIKEFDCLPAGLKVDILTENSVKEVVNSFLFGA